MQHDRDFYLYYAVFNF